MEALEEIACSVRGWRHSQSVAKRANGQAHSNLGTPRYREERRTIAHVPELRGTPLTLEKSLRSDISINSSYLSCITGKSSLMRNSFALISKETSKARVGVKKNRKTKAAAEVRFMIPEVNSNGVIPRNRQNFKMIFLNHVQ